MYSFNFSEDEENRKKKDSQYLGNDVSHCITLTASY